MKRIKIMMAALLLITALGSCQKGDKGDAGPAGANGTNGTNGANGNANVKAGLVTLTTSNWLWDATNFVDYANITDNDLTADIVASGVVCVFVSTASGSWTAIPATFIGTPSASYTFAYSASNLILEITHTDNSNSVPTPMNVKVVAISSAQRHAHPTTNWKNYNEVMQVVNEKVSL